MGIEIKKLKKYPNPKGMVYQGIKLSEYEFDEIREVYFSEVITGETKGWKKHKRMTMTLFVVSGEVDFYIKSEDSDVIYRANLGQDNYRMLKIPPGYWMAFEGKRDKNIVCNVASIEHDPVEQENAGLTKFDRKDHLISDI